jgi:hypothetical protein
MDVKHNPEGVAFPTLPTRLAIAQIDGLLAENDRLRSDNDDLHQQNRLLRSAAEQMQVEILALGRKLETMLELHEKLNVLHQENRRLRAAVELGLQTTTERYVRQTEQFSQQLREVYASSSWRLTRPWRAIGRFFKSNFRNPSLAQPGKPPDTLSHPRPE